jgi:hypothetical protein
MLNYPAQPCRISTYGNSFTQCDQVSDGETWQEYLAAHLGEPLRNYGVGGYGVYQAYLRMLREEADSEYVLLNVWSDDHYRSVYSWRTLHMPGYGEMLRDTVAVEDSGYMFHANPWAHLRMNLDTGEYEEQANPYSTPESLYALCDPDHVVDAFQGHAEVQARLAMQGATVVEKASAFAASTGKQLMVVTSYMSSDVVAACHGRPRFDQPFVDYLERQDILFVDSLAKHVEDYAHFGCTPEEYAARYYIGHYAPTGNHFFAFALKSEVVEWLSPKPPAYRFSRPPLPTEFA